MKLHFQFPRHPLLSFSYDEFYQEECEAIKQTGVLRDSAITALFSVGRERDAIPEGATVVRRCWMETSDEYASWAEQIKPAQPFTDLTAYLSTHYITRWYELLEDLTPETKFYNSADELLAGFKASGWRRAIIKDWVKSLKVAGGPFIDDQMHGAQILELIGKMLHYKGHIEGGLTLRKWEALDPDTERRYFIINGKPYSADKTDPPKIVHMVAKRLTISRFFSVDVALNTEANQLRVVEVGDGQVSDLIGWTAQRFAEVWKDAVEGENK